MHSLGARSPSIARTRTPGEIVAAATPTSQVGRRIADRAFLGVCIAFTALAVLLLVVLVVSIWQDGHARLSWQFLSAFASRKTEEAGVRAPLWGSIWVCVICAVAALPIGVGTAIYLEEFSKRSRFRSFIQLNIANLAGVPSIVYGILGLTAFARAFGTANSESPITFGEPESFFFLQLPFGHGVLAGGLTLMLVVLPIVIVSSQEALRTVPGSLRTASLALGATQWQTTWNITLPASIPMIMTGGILAMSRAIGEAAPILVLGVPLFIRSTPTNLMSDFTVLPLQIYNWSMRQQSGFHELAAAGIIVLLAVLLTLNALAVIIRHRLQRANG